LVYVIVGLHQGDHHLRGNATKFPLDRIAAHWLALAALTCVAVVAWRSVAPVRTREPARALPSRR
jgi:hypothetical protein